MPLVTLDAGCSGSCLLAVSAASENGGEPTQHVAGIQVEVERGEVVSCDSRLEQNPGTWAMGTVEAWVGAALDGNLDGLRVGAADRALAGTLIEGLHRALASP